VIEVAVDGSGLARPHAGVGVYTRRLIERMAAQRSDARFTLYAPPGGMLAAGGVTVRRVPAQPLLGRHLLWPALLRRRRSDLFLGCAGQLPLGGVGSPALVTAHDLAIYRHPEWFPEGQWLSVKVTVPRSMRAAAAVLAVSSHTAREVAELMDVPAERIRVVPLGVDRAWRRLPPDSVEAERRRLGLPERFILFFSTIEPRKNLPTLVRAWQRMDRRPELVVAGGWGWRTDEIRRCLDEAGPGLRLLGPVEQADLPALYSLAGCLAHPAWYEGFGLTPLEAMACGAPVVASNASSLPEVVGDAGLLVDPADVDGWAGALTRVLEDEELRGRLRERGLARAAELTWERTAERTWEVAAEVMGDHQMSDAPQTGE
jgi:glycosyltransferase involved in cell wall biosynthesis